MIWIILGVIGWFGAGLYAAGKWNGFWIVEFGRPVDDGWIVSDIIGGPLALFPTILVIIAEGHKRVGEYKWRLR